MTATEELRALLDERGVSHVDHGCNTAWTVGGESYAALEQVDGSLSVAPLTPQQAVDATLGRGECEDVSVKMGIFKCSSCGCTVEEDSVDWGGINFCPDCGRAVKQ